MKQTREKCCWTRQYIWWNTNSLTDQWARVGPWATIWATDSVSCLTSSHVQTAVPLQFALFELGRNPEVQQRVREQVRASWAQADGEPQKALQGAPLLKGTIKEILR